MVFKQAMISLKRRPLQYALIMVIMFLLSTITAMALIAQDATDRTHTALRHQLPAITTLRVDYEARDAYATLTDNVIPITNITPTTLREVGALSYVRLFDFTTKSLNFYSSNLRRSFDPTLFLLLEDTPMQPDLGSLRTQFDTDLEQFILQGVESSSVLDIEAGLIDLVWGRVFTDDEIQEGSYKILVSQAFLRENQLQVGDVITLYHQIFNENYFETASYLTEENLLSIQAFEFEIIGEFTHTLPENPNVHDLYIHFDLINRFYVSNRFNESLLDIYIDVFTDIYPELIEELSVHDNLVELMDFSRFLFLLEDPTYLDDFTVAISDIVPPFWYAQNLSETSYGDISASLEMIQGLAEWFFWGASLSSILILTLLILFIVRGRMQEIGIYLALGQKRMSIVGGFLIEFFTISFISITLSLLVAYGSSGQFTQALIRQDLARQVSEVMTDYGMFGDSLVGMGFHHPMSHDEMIELYTLSFNPLTVLTFYGISLMNVALVSCIPMMLIFKISPKKILTFSPDQ